MNYDPEKHHRRSIRLPGYDYASAGMYFITLCCYQRQCLFGNIQDGEMHLNPLGQIVATEWLKTPQIRPNFGLDEWVIMPNHIHGIVTIDLPNPPHPVGAHSRAPMPRAPLPDISRRHGIAHRRPKSLSSFIAGFKSATTRQINSQRNASGTPLWQRDFYEHIIRDETSLRQIQQYIQNNPTSWQNDQLHPANLSDPYFEEVVE